jgi:hypothetical protein
MDSIYQPPTELLDQLNHALTNPKTDKATLQKLLAQLIPAKAKAEQQLYELSWRMLLPKTKDVTELDRKTDLDGRTAEIKTVYHQLCDYHDFLQRVL